MKASFNNVQRHVYTIFNNIFMQCLVHVYTIFKDTFRLFLKTCLHIVWRDIFVIEDMIIHCLKTCLHNVWRHYISFRLIHIMCQGIFILSMNTCLHKDTQLIAFLQNVWNHIYSKFKIDQIVFVLENGWKSKIILF